MSSFLLGFLLIFLALWLLSMAYATWRFATRQGAKRPGPLLASLPRVSILVAARDEELALPRCLASLRALRYPAGLLEILVGDDASTDRTVAVAAAAMQGFAGQFRVVSIVGNLGRARGKANVLAHLMRQATTIFSSLPTPILACPALGLRVCWLMPHRAWVRSQALRWWAGRNCSISCRVSTGCCR